MAKREKPAQVVERVPIGSVTRQGRNHNRHEEADLQAIALSLQAFGQQSPIVVDADGVILKGNGTHQAAEERLGWTHILVVRSPLRGEAALAYSIADNQTGRKSRYDYEILGEQVQELNYAQFDMLVLGFEAHELAPLLGQDFRPIEGQGSSGGGDGVSQHGRDPHPREDGQAHAVVFPPSMWEAILEGVNRIREDEDDPTITEARAIELIVADWMSGR